MYYGKIKTTDVANGIGIRVSLFVSGCTNRCKGCFQPETWRFDFGELYTKETEDSIMEELSKPYYDGLTILGGEPFEPSNQETLVSLVKRFKETYPEKDLWMYTGFTYDKDLVPGGCRYTCYTDEILDLVDVLVDGRFIEEEKDISLSFRGSRNQRIIDMKTSRRENAVVLLENK